MASVAVGEGPVHGLGVAERLFADASALVGMGSPYSLMLETGAATAKGASFHRSSVILQGGTEVQADAVEKLFEA